VRALAAACGLAIAGAATASNDEPDVELLEYLGSWDGEDEKWHEFFDSLPAELAERAGDEETEDRSMESDPD
jgi:hypothetical protein